MVKVKKDLSGLRFGRLRALYQTEDYVAPSGHREAMYRCVCDCIEHNEVDVRAQSLKNGTTRSCGCLAKETASKNRKQYNPYDIIGDDVIIYFLNCEDSTIVDYEKWMAEPLIRKLCWFKNAQGYAYAKVPIALQEEANNKRNIFLHDIICPCSPSEIVDHKDRNRLNNRSHNLSPKTRSENAQNRSLSSNNTSKHLGVDWHEKSKKWRARITVNYRTIMLGYYENLDDAIQSYDKAKRTYHSNYQKEDI